MSGVLALIGASLLGLAWIIAQAVSNSEGEEGTSTSTGGGVLLLAWLGMMILAAALVTGMVSW